MVSFDYKVPDLLEIILLVGFFINMILGYILLFKSIQLPLAAEGTAAMTITRSEERRVGKECRSGGGGGGV
jgi:hypothetical protein